MYQMVFVGDHSFSVSDDRFKVLKNAIESFHKANFRAPTWAVVNGSLVNLNNVLYIKKVNQ